ncbi:MAG: Fe-S cluster assembly ATPase SufC [Gammaproteobacteria bacterium]|nr:Fe-S cluster assembly ATPase SufC [Gammaproteobacteria bacterium]
MSLLQVDDLHVTVDGKLILKGLTLTIEAGEVHAIMGPNGSGKSTLANVLAGRPGFEITSGTVNFEGVDLTPLEPHQRAHAGMFLAFQYPIEIPGVSNMEFLKAANDSQRAAAGLEARSAVEFMKSVRTLAESLDLNPDFLKRGVNEGFSGGERKRNEILQMLMLEPKLAVLDETDSGLDIDALQTVANGINRYHNSGNAVLLITHYQRLLNYVVPDQVHVLADGRILESGDRRLAEKLEAEGYAWVTA